MASPPGGNGDGQWLRLGPAARLLGVSINTLRRWSDAGRVPCYRSAGGHRRFARKDLDAILAKQAGGGAGAAGRRARPAPRLVDPAVVDRLKRRNDELELAVRAGLEDTSRRSSDKVLRSVARRLSRATDTPVVDVYSVEGSVMHALVSFNNGAFDREWEGTAITLDDYPCSLYAVRDQRLTVAASLDDPILTGRGRESLQRWGYQSQLSAPLLGREGVIGLVELSDFVPRDYGEHRELIGTLAQVAGRTLENARLFEETERRSAILRELVELGTLATSARDVRQLIRAVARRLHKILGVTCCDIFTLEEGDLVSAVSYDRDGFDEDDVGLRLSLADFPQTRLAIENHEPVIIPDLNDPSLSAGEHRVAQNYGYISNVCVPLVVDGQVQGLIDIFDDRPRDFAQDVDFLRTVGQLVAGALQKTTLVEQLGEGNRQLGLLVESGLEFGASLELDEVLRSVAERMRSVVATDACEVYRIQHDELVTIMSVERKGIVARDIGEHYPIPPDTPSRTSIDEREPFIVSDAATDPRLSEVERQRWSSWGYPASIRIPLVVHGDVVGLVSLYDTKPRDFEHLDLLQGLSQIAAQAVANAQLLDEVERRALVLRELVDLGALIWQSQDVGSLSHLVARRLSESIAAYCCEVWRLQDGTLRCAASYDTDDGFTEERVGGPMLPETDYPSTIEALHKREVLVIERPDDPRLTEEERRVWDTWGFQSELCIPLVLEDRVVGLIDIFDRRPRSYAHYLDFIRSVGQMVAGAFENTSLLDRLNDTNRELEMLVDSGLEFGASLDLDQVLASVASRIRAVADAACCDIYAMEGEESICLVSIDENGPDDSFRGTRYRIADIGLTRQMAETGEPVVVIDAEDDARLSDFERAEWARYGYRSSLQLPLHSGGQLTGNLCLFDTRPRDFEHVSLVQGLTHIAAQAVANATLFRRLDDSTRRLQLVNEASLELSSTLSQRSVLLSTAERLCAVADVQCCDILSLSDGLFTCLVSFNDGQIDSDYEGTSVPLDTWASDKLAVDTRATIALTGLDDPRRNQAEIDMFEGTPWQSQLNVPLIANDRVIGVIELFDRRRERVFSPGTVATVEAICNASALAIDNANLFEAMQLRRRETELLNAIARRTAASLDIEEIAAGAVEELRQLVRLDLATVAILGDDSTATTIYSTQESPAASRKSAPLPPGLDSILREVRDRRVIVYGDDEPMPAGRDTYEGSDILSAASVALLRGDDLVGIMNIGSTEANAYSGSDRRLLERVAAHLSLAINNARLYEEIKRMHLGNLKALSQALNAKDYYTVGHAARVAAYVALLGHELGWASEFVTQVSEVALLHDIGKIGVSDRVLQKPGGLNSKEWELMRQHPIFGADIIRALFDDELVLGVRHHHERWDGSGYPAGLSGDEIPIVARAMCVVDSYDAMSFRRPYKQAYWYEEAVAELKRCRGGQFDPAMVDAFCRVLERLRAERDKARAVAAAAAARIDADKHALLQTPADEQRPEYDEIAAALRAVRDANPPTRFLTTHARGDKKNFIIVVDCEDDPKMHSPLGSEVLADEEIPEVFAGRVPDVNVLYVDEWGVWVIGLAPIRDARDEVVALVSVDVPPAGTLMEGLQGEVTQTFAAMLHTTAQRLSREALDAITDGLTGLYNHRYLHERLSEEIERAREHDENLSLLFCDLDQFKSFNDTHGHSAGDAALRGVARILESCIRKVDLASRYGGEEFVGVLINTDTDGAQRVAERIRAEVAASRFIPGEDVSITISIGISTFPDDADRKEGLLDRADWAMFLAKRRGRDRVLSFAAGQKTALPGQIGGYTPGQTHVTVMAQLVDDKDPYGGRRSEAIADLCAATAERVGLSVAQIDDLLEAARACDIGMLGVPDSVIAKPGELSAEEWALIREHPMTGERLYRGLGGSERVAQTIAHHHERFDGKGYPAGLAGEAIPLAARVLHAAIAHQAMRTERPYRGRLSDDEALAEMRRESGAQFDPQVALAIQEIVAEVRAESLRRPT
jgi:diguanylate cyclase (GGDEF)-like protein/excisionase family DNA binding protein